MRSPDREPYVGPRAFGRKDHDIFFGRDREARDLCSLVVAHPIVLLYAASGAGKSSLLNAGLVPLLEEKHGCEVLPSARVSGQLPAAIQDSDVKNIYAFNVLSSWVSQSVAPEELLKSDIAAFLGMHPHRKDEAGEPVLRVVIFDQFEEIFTFAPERWPEREGFSRQLAAALEADPLLRVVIAMREEFLGQLRTYTPLLVQSARTRFHLEPLGPEAAQQAVEGPLGQTNRKIEPEAARKLVEELLKVQVTGARGEPVETTGRFVEPVQLQVTCRRLWNSLPADVQTITPALVKTFGDVNEALKQYYEDALRAAAKKSGVSEDRLRLWVEHYLITPGGTRGMVYRGVERTGFEEDAIPNAAVDVLENEKHLIRAEVRPGGEQWYELTHDRFVEPIKESNRPWREDYTRRLRLRKLLGMVQRAAQTILGTVAILLFAYFVFPYPLIEEYQSVDIPVNELLERYPDNAEGKKRIDDDAGKIRNELLGVASFLLKRKKLDRLDELLERAKRLTPNQYGADPRLGGAMRWLSENEPWPIEVLYNPERNIDVGALLYEWRSMAQFLAKLWGIPAPATLKLVEDHTIPIDYVRVVAGEERSDNIPSGTLPGFVLISQEKMPESLQPWFDANAKRWAAVEFIKNGGPWWWVPTWLQPLFEAAGHPASTRENAVAVAVASALIYQPKLALNSHNVAYLLHRLKEEEPSLARTVDEALTVRGGINVLVEDLRAIVASGHPLLRLQYLLDNLASYPQAQYSSSEVAERVIEDQTAAAPRQVGFLTGMLPAAPVKPLEEFTGIEDTLPYRDTAELIKIEPPLRVYLGKELEDYFLTQNGELHPKLLEELSDLRGELFKRLGITPPAIKFRASVDDPTGTLPPTAFRIEVPNQTPDNEDAKAIEVLAPQSAVKQFLDELRWRVFAFRTHWIDAYYVDQRLEEKENKELRTWLLNRYTLTDIKALLRGVIAPTDAELKAYDEKGFDPLQHTVPGQSLREFDWLLASLVFWSHVSDHLDAEELVQRLRDTQNSAVDAHRTNHGPPSLGGASRRN